MILTIANQKGGSGKSTTAAAIAQAAAHEGRRVLAIDLDPQANLSFFLAADANRRGAYDLFQGWQPLHLIQHTPQGIDAITASWNLQTITSSKGSARRLQQALQDARDLYDLIIIDTPPTAGEMQLNALTAADELIIPLQADIVGLQGLYQMTSTARHVNNPALQIKGYLLTRHGGRSTLARQLTEAIQREASIPCAGVIREAVAIREAQTLQRSLYDYAPRSNPALDYMTLYKSLTEEE